jgi:hypothetical protein
MNNAAMGERRRRDPCSLVVMWMLVTRMVAAARVGASSSSSSTFSGEGESLVKVYDNVMTAETADWLHRRCQEDNILKDKKRQSNNNTEKDVVFEFPLQRPEYHPPIQQLLNKILLEMYGPSNTTAKEGAEGAPMYYVEYWSRQRWIHILAHQDMDEGWERQLRESRAANSGPGQQEGYRFRHPDVGHVLYLKVGRSVGGGPTLVFNATDGGVLQNHQDATEMISIPAIPGRLLRFRGDLLHSVPRPVNIYWTFQEDDRHDPPGDWERSVLLFNLWPVDKGMIVGKAVDKSGEEAGANQDREPGEGTSPIGYTCNPVSTWKEVFVTRPEPALKGGPTSFSFFSWILGQSSSSRKDIFQVPLSGDANKRGIDGYVAFMEADEEVQTTLLRESREVTSHVVHPYKKRATPSLLSLMGIEF